MSRYYLLDPGTTAAAPAQANATNLQPQIPAKDVPHPLNGGFCTTAQSFILSVVGTGAVSATAQVLGANDKEGVYVPVGDPVTASGTTQANAGFQAAAPFRFWGAYLSAISGTGAAATLTMSV